MRVLKTILMAALCASVYASSAMAESQASEGKKLAYVVSDLRIPFWDILSRGIQNRAQALGYETVVYSADNDAKSELENIIKALRQVDGVIISPTSSSSAVTMLKLAKRAGVPVVIADIGTDGGDYVSYISSNNFDGGYKIGKILAEKMKQLDWQEGRIGIIAIPQKRANGKARTNGFLMAMKEAGISRADIEQQVDFSYRETYDHARAFLKEHVDLRAIWLQGSDRYQGALDAIQDAGRQGEVLLACFDAEPEFLQMIPEGKLIGAAMQQPFLMGEQAVQAMHDHLQGQPVDKELQLSILGVSQDNIEANLPLIKRNVLGILE